MRLTPIRHPCPLGDKARLFFEPMADGRLHCTQCSKPVKDLAGQTPEQVAEYVRANPGTCVVLGRPRPRA